MRLGCSDHVLPPLAEMLPVDDAIDSIVAKVWMKGLYLRVQFSCRDETLGFQQVENRILKYLCCGGTPQAQPNEMVFGRSEVPFELLSYSSSHRGHLSSKSLLYPSRNFTISLQISRIHVCPQQRKGLNVFANPGDCGWISGEDAILMIPSQASACEVPGSDDGALRVRDIHFRMEPGKMRHV